MAKKVLKICCYSWLNASRDKRELSACQELGLKTEVLAKGEQAIIMLNRRGWATFVMCRSCGEVIKCNECTLPMVYHNSNNSGRLVCHHCDKTVEMPKTCPKCGHVERSNRDKKNHRFTCRNCGYKSNDDRVGAMNLHRKGIEYLSAVAGG